jgi:hypothetical protein
MDGLSGAAAPKDPEAASEIWLPFLDTYRTMCLAPGPEFRALLLEVRGNAFGTQGLAQPAA